MTETEKAIRDFCGHHADWWPSTTQVQEMLALAQQNEFKPDWDEKLALTEEVICLSKRIEELEAQPSVSVEQSTECGEPVAFVKGCNRGQWEIFPAKAYQIFEREQPLYTTPPQRKPLTEQEIGAILEDINAFGTRLYTFARAIEAAHGIKEKNNG